ncbi:MAG: shikimate dehydrogenase, partial [Desulfobacterales bacterium]|nr:shikimate dehydrogenase [Desulfobacterales bacterium]
FDTIYNPIQTRLLRDAIERGALTVSGLDMFVGQGAAQLEMWTSRSAPVATYRRVVREKLG